MASTRTGRRSAPDPGKYVRRRRDAGYHTALLGKAHSTWTRTSPAPHIDDLSWRGLKQLGFSEVFETGDKFVSTIPEPLHGLSPRPVGSSRPTSAHPGTQLPRRERGRPGTPPERADVGFDADAHTPWTRMSTAWHGAEAVRWIQDSTDPEPFFLFVGFPGPHDPWETRRSRPLLDSGTTDITMPRSTPSAPSVEGNRSLWRPPELVPVALRLHHHDRRRHPRHAPLLRPPTSPSSMTPWGRWSKRSACRGLLDETWIGLHQRPRRDGGDTHGLMSKCVLYEPAVRVPLVHPSPGGLVRAAPSTALSNIFDVPATLRDARGGARDIPFSEGTIAVAGDPGRGRGARELTVSENWGFAAFESERAQAGGRRGCCRSRASSSTSWRTPSRITISSTTPHRRRWSTSDGTPRAPLLSNASGTSAPERVTGG